jgi:hypothetical protein
MTDRRGAYRGFMGKHERMKPVGNLSADERIILKYVLKQ